VAERTLLVVSQRRLDLGGGGSARWRHLRTALPRHGWRVVECSPAPGWTENESSTDPRAARLAARRAEVMAVAGRVLSPVAAALRVRPEALAPNNAWAFTGRRLARAAVARERPDVVVATAPPPSALFAAAAVVGGIPLVLEFRDLWAGNPFFDRGSRALRALQQRVLEEAAAVTTVTDGCRDVLAALHPDIAPRVHVLPNGFDPALLDRRAPPAPRSKGVATLLHSGALYGDRTAESLIAALMQGDLRDRIRLELLGVTDPRTRRAIARADGLEVTVEAPVDWEEAIRRVAAADITVVINAPSTGGDMALPNKLFEALALGRPVLALTSPGSDAAVVLERLGQSAGVAAPDDPTAITAAVERLLADPPPPVPLEALTEYDRDRIAVRYAALLDEVARRSSSSTSSATTTSRR
jgi:glycosyltransferase involved in cell wall biosynthesis